MSQSEIQKKTGNLQQLCSIRKMRFEGDAADGQIAYLVQNGPLTYTVSATLGMDISQLSCQGVNLCHITKPGWLANSEERENFIPGGMFFTCGLKNVGPPTDSEPAHGKQRFLPAENMSSFVGFEDGELKLRLCGEVREAGLFRENLLRRRTIETRYGSRQIVICDTIENQGFTDEAIMMLYHINAGYPLLDEDAELIAPSKRQTARDESSAAAKGESDLFRMDAPKDGYPEQVFYHELGADAAGNTFCALKNSRLGMALKVGFNKNELPVFTQWKSIASGDYVMGMEPGICHVEGMARERELGTLVTLRPGQTRSHTLTLSVLTEQSELDALQREVKQ